MKIQSPRQRIVTAVGAVAIALATAGASQAGAVGGPEYGIVRISQATGVGDDQGKLVIGFNMTVGLTAPNATGTFVAAGAVNDSGASTATVTLTPSANNLAREGDAHLYRRAGNDHHPLPTSHLPIQYASRNWRGPFQDCPRDGGLCRPQGQGRVRLRRRLHDRDHHRKLRRQGETRALAFDAGPRVFQEPRV